MKQTQVIADKIHVIHGLNVLLDSDLAALYGVPTKVLLQAVKRNANRFPCDFMFRLNDAEWRRLRSQIVTSNLGRGGRRSAPSMFTEQGVAMLSSVLHSQQAIAVNIEIMRAFVQLREVDAVDKELLIRLRQLENRSELFEHEIREQIQQIFAVIQNLIASPPRPKRPIGFVTPDK